MPFNKFGNIEKYMIIEKEHQPLVSIIVIIYNSARYVLETLESVKAQTYQNVELVISDDCSTDDTVAICRKWIEENNERFVRTEIVTTLINTGISANCNRGAKAACGKWLKFISGDDILTSACIQEFINFTYIFPQANIIASKQYSFTEINETKTFFGIHPEVNSYNEAFFMVNSSTETQYKYLLNRKVQIAGPAYIVKKELLLSINYFDEKYKLLEDYPLFLRASECGNYLYFLDRVTVYYRLHQKSISYRNNIEKIYPDFFHDWYRFLMNYNYKRLNIINKFDLLIEVFIYKIVLLMGNRGKFAMMLWKNSSKFYISRYLRFFGVI